MLDLEIEKRQSKILEELLKRINKLNKDAETDTESQKEIWEEQGLIFLILLIKKFKLI